MSPLFDAQVRSDSYGYPVLHFFWGGRPVRISSEQIKRTLLAEGYVFLGSEWRGRVPMLYLPSDPADGRGLLPLPGFTRDPAIVALVRHFIDLVDSGQVVEGPLALERNE